MVQNKMVAAPYGYSERRRETRKTGAHQSFDGVSEFN